jgi:drug/metabolite transporter (DMT)-like permease
MSSRVLQLLQHDLIKGFLCLAMVVIIWVASGFIAQAIFTEYKFYNFAAISVYSLMIGMVNLLPLMWRKLKRDDLPTTMQIGVLGLLWQAGQMLFVISLMYTTMGTNMALQSCSGAFSYIFSLIILKYDFRWWSAFGVALVMGSVILASFYPAEAIDKSQDSSAIKETVTGFVLAIAAAMNGALFSNMFKKWVTKPANSDLIFGFFGVIAIVVGIPLLVIFHYTGVQQFEVPSWQVALLILADAIICSVICNKFFFPRAFIYLTPVTVQVGLTMTIPLSYIVTIAFLHTHTYHWLAFVAATMIFVAVVIVSFDQAKYKTILDEKEKEATANETNDIEESKEHSVATEAGHTVSA